MSHSSKHRLDKILSQLTPSFDNTVESKIYTHYSNSTYSAILHELKSRGLSLTKWSALNNHITLTKDDILQYYSKEIHSQMEKSNVNSVTKDQFLTSLIEKSKKDINQFNIYKPQGIPLRFHNDLNHKDYYAQLPLQFGGEMVALNGFGDTAQIEYIKQFKDANLQPILYNNKAVMTLLISRYSKEKTNIGPYLEVVFNYWVTNTGKQLILNAHEIDPCMVHMMLSGRVREGIMPFADNVYLNSDFGAAVGREFGYDKHKTNDMQFEYNINNAKVSRFTMKCAGNSLDIKLNINNDPWNDFGFVLDMIKNVGMKNLFKMSVSGGRWTRAYTYTKPNIAATRIVKDKTPLHEIPWKTGKTMLKMVSEKDAFEFKGGLKDRKFVPVTYSYYDFEFAYIPPINC